MSIYAFDIDITGVLHKQEPYLLGEPEVVSKFIAPWQCLCSFLTVKSPMRLLALYSYQTYNSIPRYLPNQRCMTSPVMTDSKSSFLVYAFIKYPVGN